MKRATLTQGIASLAVCAGLLSMTASAQPVIAQQPQSQTNLAGTTATFSLTATGTPPLACQWQGDCGILSFCDLKDQTNATLVLTNVATGGSVFYRVVITNIDGAVTSAIAQLTILPVPIPPQIKPATSLQHRAEDFGAKVSFAVTASGMEPLTYQWRMDGHELAGQTNRLLTFNAVQPADEGDYTVVVTNPAGAVTSEPVRLWVTPPASAFVKGSFTNSLGRLPYYYLLPANYDATRSYPLYVGLYGVRANESQGPATFAWPAFKTWSSYRQQERDPVIELRPLRRGGDGDWTDAYLRQVSALLDQFILQVNADTNRIYVSGASLVYAVWNLIAMKPGFFAGATFAAGPQGSRAGALKDVPVWAICARDDDVGQSGNTQAAVRALRLAGGNVRYTEYVTGKYTDSTGLGNSSTHFGGFFMGWTTPVIVDWLLAQRRGVPSTAEPLLSITNPTAHAVWLTGATDLNLAGSAAASDQGVTRVAWENAANRLTGVAEGTNSWSVAGLPLVVGKTNIVVVTGTTTSWAPACGGNTTFNQTLMAVCSPIRATLALQGTTALLNWTGGGPPYRVQRATDLLTADWTEVLSDATPPLALPVTGLSGFYRIVGQ
jgi:hypothetical protein